MNEGKELAITDAEVKAVSTGQFDMAHADGLGSLKQAEAVVGYMSAKCSGPAFISSIQGKKYPLVTWWTTVGAAMGLFPQEVTSVKTKDDPLTYEAVVEVRHGNQVVSRASAICSKDEMTWRRRDEYAIKSMATTRATGKAYRIAFAFLAVLAGLEPTPAEEMPAPEPEPKTQPQRPADQMAVISDIKALVEKWGLEGDERDVWRKKVQEAHTVPALVAIRDELAMLVAETT